MQREKLVSELITDLLQKRKVRARQMLTTRKCRNNLEVVSSILEVEAVKDREEVSNKKGNKFLIA